MYLVTTQIDKINKIATPIIMVDGTVPGWLPRDIDFHFDHHRDNGSPIQIDEIPWWTWDNYKRRNGDALPTFVTTQVDADACVAAAFFQLLGIIPLPMPNKLMNKLRAIAWDCDHLYVPDELKEFSDFAAQCVAALKHGNSNLGRELSLPPNRKDWSIDQKELYTSTAFKIGTEWLMDAALGRKPFPGELGEAALYWKQVEDDEKMFLDSGRITYINQIVLIDCRGLSGKYIDPRASLRAIKKDWDKGERFSPITVTVRDVYLENILKGYSFTLGNFPQHPDLKFLDYIKGGIFNALTQAEKKINPSFESWGGRKTVGGSSWNNVSGLTPEQVIEIITNLLDLDPIIASK